MTKLTQELIFFVFSFIVVFILYQLFIVRRAKKKGKNPIEVTYLISKYKLDIDKVNYKKLLRVISLVSSFDIALVVAIMVLCRNFILEIIVGFVTMLITIFISYHLVYLVYKRGGMIKDEHKRNRK